MRNISLYINIFLLLTHICYLNIFLCFIYIFSIILVPQDSGTSALCTSGRRWLYRRVRRSCKKKLLFKRIPILTWLPNYRKEYIVSDLVAGITVGLTVIPQAIAYANVAGLPLQASRYVDVQNNLK